ncbi:hypothetical protein COV18_06500 [Candidatus Woesearchaeota archaeon CG10_big_fil_rev_8_21_14_0_10_37_12]|nr:MAG: hypothetical protein COV18_06500 [Candidatus Woesearchaeota archaeon CG10_big_fil_rev_8_21_14_0_10_37_12]
MFQTRNFNKSLIHIVSLFGLITLVEGILWYFMPLYFESKLQNLFLVGVLISIHPFASLIVSLPTGDLCDKISRRFVFILGLLGFTMAFFLLQSSQELCRGV